MTFYAKPDGEGAPAGRSLDMISPTIKAWLGFNYANPGSYYPEILKEFQWGVLNRCEQVTMSTRQIQFIKGPPKPWSVDEFF